MFVTTSILPATKHEHSETSQVLAQRSLRTFRALRHYVKAVQKPQQNGSSCRNPESFCKAPDLQKRGKQALLSTLA